MLKFNNKKAFDLYLEKLVSNYSWQFSSSTYWGHDIKVIFYWNFTKTSRFYQLDFVLSNFIKDIIEIDGVFYTCRCGNGIVANKDYLFLTPI